MDALTAYRLFATDKTATLERFENRADISREIEYYKQNIGKITSAEDLVNEPRLFSFVMRAYNLEDMSYAKALMRRVMEEGVERDNALANSLTDPRYQELATDFNFARYGDLTNTFSAVRTGVVEKYLRTTVEIEAGSQSDGARLAMYFERKAANVENAFEILAEPALLKFVQTAFNLPSEMSFMDIDKQAELINDRLDFSKLSEADYQKKLTDRFLALLDLSNPSSVSIPPLVSSSNSVQGLGSDILLNLQKINFRS